MLSFTVSGEVHSYLEKPMVQGTEGGLQPKVSKGAEAHKETNTANNHTSSEMDPFPVEPQMRSQAQTKS